MVVAVFAIFLMCFSCCCLLWSPISRLSFVPALAYLFAFASSLHTTMVSTRSRSSTSRRKSGGKATPVKAKASVKTASVKKVSAKKSVRKQRAKAPVTSPPLGEAPSKAETKPPATATKKKAAAVPKPQSVDIKPKKVPSSSPSSDLSGKQKQEGKKETRVKKTATKPVFQCSLEQNNSATSNKSRLWKLNPSTQQTSRTLHLDSGLDHQTEKYINYGAKDSQVVATIRSEVQLARANQLLQGKPEKDYDNTASRAKTDTAGAKWFDMPAPVIDDALKHDLKVLQLRNYMDPKRFYKANDNKKNLPKYFQIATVIDGFTERSMNSALPSKKRKASAFVNEILQDAKIKNYAKRVYNSVQNSKNSGGKNSYKKQQNKKRRHGWQKS